MRYETAPGEQAQVDWKEDFTFLTTDVNDKLKVVQ